MARVFLDVVGEVDGVTLRLCIGSTVQLDQRMPHIVKLGLDSPFLNVCVPSTVHITFVRVQGIGTVHTGRLEVPLTTKRNIVLVILVHTPHTASACEEERCVWRVKTTSVVRGDSDAESLSSCVCASIYMTDSTKSRR